MSSRPADFVQWFNEPTATVNLTKYRQPNDIPCAPFVTHKGMRSCAGSRARDSCSQEGCKKTDPTFPLLRVGLSYGQVQVGKDKERLLMVYFWLVVSFLWAFLLPENAVQSKDLFSGFTSNGRRGFCVLSGGVFTDCPAVTHPDLYQIISTAFIM